MPNSDAERQALELRDLKMKYAELEDHPALVDLTNVLNESYAAAHNAAMAELNNGTRAVAALQQANAYDRIRSYISDMLA